MLSMDISRDQKNFKTKKSSDNTDHKNNSNGGQSSDFLGQIKQATV